MGAKASKHLGAIRSFVVANGVTVTAGDVVMIRSDGYVSGAVAAAANKGCVGVAMETVVGNGTLRVKVQEGTYLLVGVGLAIGEVGDTVYMSDAQTFSNTQAANEPVGGRLVDFVSSTSGWVAMGVALKA